IPPQPAVVPPAGAPSSNVSTRELFQAHEKNDCAKVCHTLIDPPGFAFENYDAIGHYRTMDGGKPVDASASLIPPSGGAAVSFRDGVDFVNLLAAMPDVQRCFAMHWFRFALGREEVPGDGASLQAAGGTFARSGQNIRELM